MRYVVKAYITHEEEEARAEEVLLEGVLDDVERLEGYVLGTCDEDGVARLANSGLTVSVAPFDPAPLPAGETFALKSFSMRAGDGFATAAAMPSVRRPDGRSEYFLLKIPGGLSPKRKTALGTSGVSVLEREAGDWYVAKLPNRRAVFELPFVSEVRLYGAAETLAAAPSAPEAAAVLGVDAPRPMLWDVVLHRDADAEEFARELAALGVRVLSRSENSMRLMPGRTDVADIADIPSVATLQPVFAAKMFDDEVRRIVGLEVPDRSPPRVVPLDGAGELIGVADTGIDDAHPDFTGRVHSAIPLGRPGDHSDPDGHGTHVAGTILGDGSASNRRLAGMAPAARLFFQSVLDVNGRLGGLPADVRQLYRPAYDAGVRIHNNSWGAYLYTRYGAHSTQTDSFVHAHPDFLVVIAAGNEGSCLPGVGGRPKGFVDYPSLAAPATAKNGLTVGASRSSRTKGGYSRLTWGAAWAAKFPDAPIRDEAVSGDPEAMAGFSSRGPCDYGMIKPDLTAPGTDVASARSRTAPLRNFWGAYPGNQSYAFMGGTSMAAPVVTGCAALVRQHYREVEGHAPSAALLKATLINGTVPLAHESANASPAGFPNYDQGFGRLDMPSTLPNSSRPSMRLRFIDCPSTTPRLFATMGQRHRWELELDADGELRICLAWTDPPGRGLQNGLAVLLDQGPLGRKWTSNNGASTLIRLIAPDVWAGLSVMHHRDASNNVHILRVPDAAAGLYTLTLVADFMTTDSQSYAVALTGPISRLDQRP